MKRSHLCLLYVFVLSCLISEIEAVTFHEINLEGFEKKILSEKQIRFTNKEKLKVHIQIDTHDSHNEWKKETLKDDVEKMFSSRKKIYEHLGFQNVLMSNYSFEKGNDGRNRLTIHGEYTKINKKKVYFLERNIYFKDRFIQIKILNNDMPIKNKELENIEEQAKLDSLVVLK